MVGNTASMTKYNSMSLAVHAACRGKYILFVG